MKRIAIFVAAIAALITAATALAGGGTGITASPATTKPFDGGNCAATFVRAASGIINETNRACAGAQNPWSSYDVWIQFRPLTGPSGIGSPTPNPACDQSGLVATGTFVNSEASIGGTPSAGYFINSNPYRVCVYYARPFSLTLRVDGTTSLTTTVGHHIDYSGSFKNGNAGVASAAVSLDVFTGTGCNPANTLYTGISAGSTDANGNYDFVAGPSPLGTYSVIGHSTSPLGAATSNCIDIVVQGVVTSGSVDSTSEAGSTVNLPLAGKYRIDVTGTWDNTSHGLVDAEYNNGDSGHQLGDFTALTAQDNWPGLGADFGDLLVNGSAVNWGAYNDAHAYSTTLSTGGSLGLRVFDGDASSGSLLDNGGWYGDNAGSLNYTITYLGS